MTLDEAIRHTEDVARIKQEASIYLADEHPTQAEKCEECAKEHRQLAEWLKELKAYRNKSEIPTSCGDAISRQAVEKITWEEPTFTDALNVLAEVRDKVRALPSVSPQQRTGRWINSRVPESTLCECSVCGFTCGAYSFNYCPDCGAKMEVEE